MSATTERTPEPFGIYELPDCLCSTLVELGAQARTLDPNEPTAIKTFTDAICTALTKLSSHPNHLEEFTNLRLDNQELRDQLEAGSTALQNSQKELDDTKALLLRLGTVLDPEATPRTTRRARMPDPETFTGEPQKFDGWLAK
ncbi:hypothetical protein EX30DRAFT_352845, partial [Ascodesmis nigricans]